MSFTGRIVRRLRAARPSVATPAVTEMFAALAAAPPAEVRDSQFQARKRRVLRNLGNAIGEYVKLREDEQAMASNQQEDQL